MPFLERDLIHDLISWSTASKRKPLLLEGARQVGKTALLKHFGNERFPNFYYFNFERDAEIHRIFEGELDPKRIIEELEIKLQQPIDPFKSLIIFDEIQVCSRALTSLKYFAEDLPESFIAAAGSLLGITLGVGSFPVGQVTRKTLYPLSFQEFIRANSDSLLLKARDELVLNKPASPFVLDKIWELLLGYFACGGLPEAVLAWQAGKTKLEKTTLIQEVQERIYRDYLADIAKHSGSENAMHIEGILQNIPNQLARELDGSASKFQFKNVIKGRKSFEELRGPIDWLKRAGLIHQVFIAEKALPPLSAYCKDNRFKLYLFDLGILRHLSAFQPEQLMSWGDNMYKGFYAENFVLLELLSQGQPPPKAWREGDSEVEFLVETNDGIIPLEVKSGMSRRTRSLKSFIDRYHPKQAIVLAGRRMASKNETIHTYPLFAPPAGIVLKKS